MSLIPRFSAVDKAILVSTGNTLVICGSTTEPKVNTSSMIKIDGNETRDYTQAGSTAKLNILANSTILYAELLWYSTVTSNATTSTSVASIQDSPIDFTTSKGTYQIAPQYSSSYTTSSGSINRYRAAEVTSYIQDALSGNYTVSKVPTSLPSEGLSDTTAGWTLSVVYRNDILPPSKILYTSGIWPITESTPLQTTLTGFATDSYSIKLKGNLFLACANGSPINGAEFVSVGPSFARLTNIGNNVNSPNPNPGTSPNNPGNSFFSGVINVADPLSSSNGLLDISGTNGTKNHDGFIPTQVLNARNKWDITNIDISDTLIQNQTLLANQITTTGSGIELLALGSQVNTKAPNITASLDIYDIDLDDEYNIEVGESIVYHVTIKNDGNEAANNVILSSVLNSVTSFIPGSVKINTVSNPTASIENGINIGTIAAKGIVNVLFAVKINSVPEEDRLLKQSINYNYQFTSGIDTITNSAKTNTIQVIVQNSILSVTKTASKTTAIVGDDITYTVNISNIGTEVARNIIFQDRIDLSTSFIPESVVIDGVSYPNYDPTIGFKLPDLLIGASTEIVFSSKINTLPVSAKVYNTATVSFGYIFNQYGYLREKTVFSNTTSTKVNYTNIIGERCNDNNYPKVEDTVTYTLSLTNTGNVDATNIQVLEPPIPGTTFVSGSVNINGTIQNNLNPFTGFILENPIGPSQTTDIEYKVLINEINQENLIENIAQVPFKYKIEPNTNDIENEIDSNKVDTIANYVCMNISETVDKDYAVIGDDLYYKVIVSNNGNISATDTVFLSAIQSETSFINGSVYINGISYPNYNPTQGFTLGKICANEEIEITYKAKVNLLPNPNVVYNQSDLVFSYQPDPNGSKLSDTIYSNTVQTIIEKASYTVTKSVDKNYAQVGDYLVYTTTIENTGTVPLTNLKFADYIGKILSFEQGSVYINNIHYPTYNPTQQFEIETMHPGDTTTIIFGVNILSNTKAGYIPNTSELTMTYQETPNSPTITKTVYSNTVKTYDPVANLSIVKSVDKDYALVGDTLTYYFTITNTGNTNVNDIFFTDVLQLEADFITNSVYINDINKPGFNPTTGFTLGNINMGETTTVSFKVRVDSLPNPNNIKNNAVISYSYYVAPSDQPISKTSTSNTVTTIINSYSATLTKYVDKTYATIGDTLNYTVIATNTGTVPLTNVNLRDIIQSEATFVEDSVIIDNVSYPNYNPNNGFIINDVLPGGNVVVMFKATVTALPLSGKIDNTANTTLKYRLSPKTPYIDSTITSNTVTTYVKTMNVTNTKSVDKMYATIGDTLTYTLVIANNSNVDITDTKLIDTVPTNTIFIPGTVKINSSAYSDYDPNAGFTLGTITPGSSVTVTFNVSVDTLPSSGFVTNSSTLNYQYNIDPTSMPIHSSVDSNTVTTYINKGDLTITKSANRTIVRLGNVIEYNFVIINTGNTLLKTLFFKDEIQLESSFNEDSVYINNVNKPGYNPNNGFSLDDIPVGQQTTINFTVTANDVPDNNELLNMANVDYSYYVDPNATPITSTKASNQTTVYVYNTIMSANKSVDKSIAKIGDILTFTIDIYNEGNVSSQQVSFKDILDSNISFVENSVEIEGVSKPGYNPNDGFNLDDIQANSSVTVTFKATVNTRPVPGNIIYNYATIPYEYTVDGETVSATITTNTTQTYVATGELTITKVVNKVYATVGDTLNYSVVVKNTGSVKATNLNFKDLMPQSTSFVAQSVFVDTISQPTFVPETGFILSDLEPNQYHIVTFSIHVDSLPSNGLVENTADTTFTYKLTESDNPVTITATSNKVTTYIKIGMLNSTKSVDKLYATINDTIVYTINITNQGNATCSNIFFEDIIQSNATFIPGSVIVNNESKPEYNPNDGFILGDIAGFETTTVSFSAKVVSIPPVDYTIYNYSMVDYNYYIDPTAQPVIKESLSNTVSTIINKGSLKVTKSVNKYYATVEDVLTYTVSVLNDGNTTAKNINFRDVIPNGLTFVPDSVTIDGVSYPGYNPYSSFTLGNIISGDTVVVSFNATVTSVPTPSLVNNTAELTFAYRIDPNKTDIYSQINSNTVTTQINLGSLNITKTVDKMYATKGDILTYTFTVTNNGNVDATNVIFIDNLQSDITFNTGTVKVNDTTYENYNPNNGFSLGTITPLSSVNVSFTVTVIQNTTTDVVLNYALSTFSYKVEQNGEVYNKSSQSNTVYTVIKRPSMTATKTVDKIYATLQDTLNYSILVTNTGNTIISELSFADILSDGALFKASTVLIDGVSYPTYDPIIGFNLPNNLIAGNTSLVQFQATVMSVPTPPQVTNYATLNGMYKIDPQGDDYQISTTSNTVTTNINKGSLSNSKTVDKMYARVNDTVTYTSTITNTGNVAATNLSFVDILEPALSYVSGTVRINNVVYPSLNPINGFELSDLLPGQVVTVSFDAKINTLPTPAYVSNTSQVVFSYKLDPNGTTITNTQNSNTTQTNVVLGQINTTKTVDKSIATIGDVLTYTITLINVGNVIASDVLFTDIPSKGATFNTGSIKINGESYPTYDPTVGFSLEDIGIGNVVTVEFAATVTSVPDTNKVTNYATVTFKYTVDPKDTPYSNTTYSNTVTTNIAYGDLSVTKAVNKQYATIGEKLTYTITIQNIGNINATNVVFLDPTPRNSTFVLGTVTVNGTPYPNYNPSAGFNLNTMTPGQIITVVYQVEVIDLC